MKSKKKLWKKILGTLLAASLAAGLMPGMSVSALADTAHTHDDITFTEWTSDNSLPTDVGSYYLTKDVNIASTWVVPSGEVNLCLNGHGITLGEQSIVTDEADKNHSVIRLNNDESELNIYDDTTTEHWYYIDGKGLGHVVESRSAAEEAVGSITIDESDNKLKYNPNLKHVGSFTGGYITGGKGYKESSGNLYTTGGGIYANKGSLNIYGGTIIGNEACALGNGIERGTGGGICLGYGKSSIKGGMIIGNVASDGGGIRTSWGESAFTMTGGTIAYNSSLFSQSGGGGGIDVQGSFELKGGSIVHNYSTNHGGGINYNSCKKTVEISGSPKINDNVSFGYVKGCSGAGFYYFADSNGENKENNIINKLIIDGTEGWPDITGNICLKWDEENISAVDSNLEFNMNGLHYINISGDKPSTSNSVIGIKVLYNDDPSYNQSFTEGASADGKQPEDYIPYFVSDDEEYTIGRLEGQSTELYYLKKPYVVLDDTKKPIITLPDGHTVPQIGDLLTASSEASKLTYQWYRGDDEIDGATAKTYTVAEDDYGKTIKVAAIQAKNDFNQEIDPAIVKESAPTSAVIKRTAEKLSEETAKKNLIIDYSAETVNVKSGFEVSLYGSEKTDVPAKITELLDVYDSPKVYVRTAETDDTSAGNWVAVTLASRSDAPTGLTTEDASDASTADGKIKGTNEKMEYKLKNSDGSWTTASSSETKVKAGRYLVRFKAADNTPASKAVELNVAIEGSEGIGIILTEDQKPTKKTGLVFDHSEQALVNAAKAALPSGYTMKYALGNDKVSAPTSGWTTSIPKGLEPKTYYVWFKAVGEAESEAECIEVTIGKSEDEQEYEKLMPVLKIVKKDTIAIETTDGYEYSIDGGDTWTSSGSFTNLSPGTDYTICMRKQDTTDIIGSIFVTTAKDDKTSTTIEMKDVVKTGDGYIRTETRIEGDAAVAGVANLDADFVLDLLSKDEKGKEELEKIRNGAALLVYMQVSNADESASEEDKKKIDDAAKNLNNAAVHQLINISLYKKIGNEDAEEISDFNSRTIGVTLEIPDELKKTESNEAEASALTEIESQSENMQVLAETEREFYIAGVNGDKAEIIDSTTSDDGNTISFEAEKFCMTYALLYSDSEVEPTPGEETQKTQSANERILVVKNKSDISRLFSKYGETGYKYKFKIENKAQKAIMTVSKKGRIKVKKPGTATIALLRKVKGGYWAKVEEQTLTAEKPDLPKKITNLKVGDTVYATSFIKNTMVSSPTSYISSKSKIASIDSSTGKITVHKSGTAKITIIYGSGKGAAKYNVKIKIG